MNATRRRSAVPKRLIITADDFGLSESVNEAVERAHRDGVLTSASLMVAAPAAADAVRRAKSLPSLSVGLHLVAIEGQPVSRAPGLVDASGKIPSDQLGLGLAYAFSPTARRQLAAEIRAQFAAYADTGLKLDHADAHKHMHLHPTVGKLLLMIGREFGLRAVRVPAEPSAIIASCGTPASLAAHAMHAWTRLFRHQARRAGMAVTDAVFGLAWSGHVTAERLLRLIPNLPAGTSELYCHPASRADPALTALMPSYEHQAEFSALLDPRVRAMLRQHAILPTRYGEVA